MAGEFGGWPAHRSENRAELQNLAIHARVAQGIRSWLKRWSERQGWCVTNIEGMSGADLDEP